MEQNLKETDQLDFDPHCIKSIYFECLQERENMRSAAARAASKKYVQNQRPKYKITVIKLPDGRFVRFFLFKNFHEYINFIVDPNK